MAEITPATVRLNAPSSISSTSTMNTTAAPTLLNTALKASASKPAAAPPEVPATPSFHSWATMGQPQS